MSSSWGNTINLFDSPNEMFGKIMSLKDGLIIKYFILTTRLEITRIEKYQEEMKSEKNPKDYKMGLAFEIVRFFHSEKEAKKAKDYFIKTFSNKEVPDEITEVNPTDYSIITVLIEAGFATSKSDAKRIIEQKGVKINKIVANDTNVVLEKNDVVQKGKRFFVKVK